MAMVVLRALVSMRSMRLVLSIFLYAGICDAMERPMVLTLSRRGSADFRKAHDLAVFFVSSRVAL